MVDGFVFKLWRAVARFFHGVPDDEAAKCEGCMELVPPHAGVRGQGPVCCGDECVRTVWERNA